MPTHIAPDEPPPAGAHRGLDRRSTRSFPSLSFARRAPPPPPLLNNALSRRHLRQAIQMANEAAEADLSGDESFAVDAHLHSLEFLLAALPTSATASLRPEEQEALRAKLGVHLNRLGLAPQQTSTSTPTAFAAPPTAPAPSVPPSPVPNKPAQRWQDRVIGMAVSGAVMLKHSPLPYLAFGTVSTVVRIAQEADVRLRLHERAFEAAGSVIDVMLRLNAEYEVHRWVAEVGWVLWEAGVRGAVAFGQADAWGKTDSAPPTPPTPPTPTTPITPSRFGFRRAMTEPPPAYTAQANTWGVAGLGGAAAGAVRKRVFGF